MKKLIYFIAGLLISCVAMTSCEYFDKQRCQSEKDSFDTNGVYAAVEEYMNPVFVNVDAAIDFREAFIDEQHIEETFVAIPTHVLCDVCKVLQRRNIPLTMASIVTEYDSGKMIYDNLPPDDLNDDLNHYSPNTNTESSTGCENPAQSKKSSDKNKERVRSNDTITENAMKESKNN